MMHGAINWAQLAPDDVAKQMKIQLQEEDNLA
jgi:hypothetical protein